MCAFLCPLRDILLLFQQRATSPPLPPSPPRSRRALRACGGVRRPPKSINHPAPPFAPSRRAPVQFSLPSNPRTALTPLLPTAGESKGAHLFDFTVIPAVLPQVHFTWSARPRSDVLTRGMWLFPLPTPLAPVCVCSFTPPPSRCTCAQINGFRPPFECVDRLSISPHDR